MISSRSVSCHNRVREVPLDYQSTSYYRRSTWRLSGGRLPSVVVKDEIHATFYDHTVHLKKYKVKGIIMDKLKSLRKKS